MARIRLADGSTARMVATPWTTSGDTVIKWLVVIEGVGNIFLTNDELSDRLVVEE